MVWSRQSRGPLNSAFVWRRTLIVSKGWLCQMSVTPYAVPMRLSLICSPNTQLCYTREDTSDEALVLASVGGGYSFFPVILVDAGRRGFLHRHESPVVPRRATMMFILGFVICARISRRVTGRRADHNSNPIDAQLIKIYDIIPLLVSKGKICFLCRIVICRPCIY
jgi:hypothetical protein